jgi:hypothetical protein
VERAKGWADQLWHAEEVREAAAADKKRLEDELAEERRKAVEATTQFNTPVTSKFFSLRPF